MLAWGLGSVTRMRFVWATLVAVSAIAGVWLWDLREAAQRPVKEVRTLPFDADAHVVVPKTSVIRFDAADYDDPRLHQAMRCTIDDILNSGGISAEWWAEYDRAAAEGLEASGIMARAEAGEHDAMLIVAFLYANDDSQTTLAREWLLRAGEAGIGSAQNEIGYGYVNGAFGFETDAEQGREWLERAIGNGDQIAGYGLARLYRVSLVQPPEGETRSRFELAHDINLHSAQYCYAAALEDLARDFTRGHAVERDLAAAGHLRRLVSLSGG